MKSIFVIIVGLLLTTGQAMAAQAVSQNPFGSDIHETINRLSKKLPMVVDKGTGNGAASRDEKVIHIRRAFRNYSTKLMEKREIESEKPQILNAFCSDDALRNYMDRDISFHFDYYGKNGLHIASTVVDRRNCQPQTLSGQHTKIADRAGVYIVYGNGIVKDTSTNLEWVTGPDRNVTWDEANAWAKGLRLAGGGWRLPTLKELETLYKKGAGPRNMTPCLKTNGWWVWSCETVGTREARSFAFGHGYKGWIFKGNSASERVFAVRLPDKR